LITLNKNIIYNNKKVKKKKTIVVMLAVGKFNPCLKRMTFGRNVIIPRSLTSSINKNYLNVDSVPYVENYRSSWPDLSYYAMNNNNVNDLAKPEFQRTVPNDALSFKMNASLVRGRAEVYRHLKYNPTDFKVSMKVKIWN
jgi:hypothetical protein